MIISFPTAGGDLYSICLNAATLKLLACILTVLALAGGYVVMQVATFFLQASPSDLLRLGSVVLVVAVCAYVRQRKKEATV